MCTFSPRAVSHLMGTVVHAHQRLLVIDARQHQDDRRVGDNQVQVVLGEVKVDRLKSEYSNISDMSFIFDLELATMYRTQCKYHSYGNMSCHF